MPPTELLASFGDGGGNSPRAIQTWANRVANSCDNRDTHCP